MVGTVSFFVLLSVSCGKGTFYIPTGNSTWSGYNNGCIPATPKVKVGTDMNYYLDESLDVDLPFNDKVWVGYYQVVRVFEYIGCVVVESIVNNKQLPFVEINGDPGHCFPGCGDHTIVGVTKTKCYCLGSNILLTQPTLTDCRDKCNHPIVSCGNDHTVMKYDFLSIYKMNPSVTASAILYAQNEKGNCLALDPLGPKTFYWKECTHKLEPMCAKGSLVTTLIRRHESQRYFTWINAANVCFTNRMFPTNYSNAKDVHGHGVILLWTGMFKTNIVYKSESNIPDERSHDQKFYGYLTRNVGDGVTLQFTGIDSNQRRLCDDEKENENSARSTASSTTIDGNKKEVKNENSTHSTASPTTIDGNAESSSEMYVIIGVCVSVLLLSLIIVSLACFYRHRIVPNVSSQAYYISPTYSTRIYENNVTVTNMDHRDVQHENSDLTSQHYYATPTEIIYEQNQELQSFRNATREVNHKEDHDTEELTNTDTYESLQEKNKEMYNYETPTNVVYQTGTYESLQEDNTEMHNYETPTNVAYQTGTYESLQEDNSEMHNYETPTNAAYQTVNESMIDVHEYGMLQN